MKWRFKTGVMLFNVKYFPHSNCSLVKMDQRTILFWVTYRDHGKVSRSKYNVFVKGCCSQFAVSTPSLSSFFCCFRDMMPSMAMEMGAAD